MINLQKKSQFLNAAVKKNLKDDVKNKKAM